MIIKQMLVKAINSNFNEQYTGNQMMKRHDMAFRGNTKLLNCSNTTRKIIIIECLQYTWQALRFNKAKELKNL
jgi:hypothetical protein